MLPVGESVSNGWRRMVLFRGVGMLGDAMLMSSLRWSMSMSLSCRWRATEGGRGARGGRGGGRGHGGGTGVVIRG